MKRYGLRIGNVGVEFPSRDERQKAMIAFTSGTCSQISNEGVRFQDDKGTFSTYERDDKEVLVNCKVCKGVFGVDACSPREFPFKSCYSTQFVSETGHICDACFEAQRKAKELDDAKKVVSAAETKSVF